MVGSPRTSSFSQLFDRPTTSQLGTGTPQSYTPLWGDGSYRSISDSDLPDLSSSYVTPSSLSSTLSGYATTLALSAYQPIGDYATNAALASAVAPLVSLSALTASLASYSLIGHIHSASDITSGTLTVAQGGTGNNSALTAGQIWYAGSSGVAAGSPDLAFDHSISQFNIAANRSVPDSVAGAQVYVKNSFATGSGHAGFTLDKGANSAVACFSFAVAGALDWQVGVHSHQLFMQDWSTGNIPVLIEAGATTDSLRVKSDSSVYMGGGSVVIDKQTGSGDLLVLKAINLHGNGSGFTIISCSDTSPKTSYVAQDNGGNLVLQTVDGSQYSDSASQFYWRQTGGVTLMNMTHDGYLKLGWGSVEMTDSSQGVILRSPDSTRYQVKVANGGTLTVTAI